MFVLTWLALLFACAFPPAVIAADDDTPIPLLGGHLRETRIVYPMTVQEWRAQGEQRYEQAEAGVSVRYTRENAEAEWLDVYIYPIGEVGTALLDAHMAQTVDELQGIAGRPMAGRSGSARCRPSGFRWTRWTATAQMAKCALPEVG